LHTEDHPRLLALLDQPRLALLLAAGKGRPLTAADLAGGLMAMAQWSATEAVALLLAPDNQRKSHPSVDLEPERRCLDDLGPASGKIVCPLLDLTPGGFIRWG
jgi:3,4-dihydroxy 2-butanone 4-phosphate synthase/GTP cyclohydrolase II